MSSGKEQGHQTLTVNLLQRTRLVDPQKRELLICMMFGSWVFFFVAVEYKPSIRSVHMHTHIEVSPSTMDSGDEIKIVEFTWQALLCAKHLASPTISISSLATCSINSNCS